MQSFRDLIFLIENAAQNLPIGKPFLIGERTFEISSGGRVDEIVQGHRFRWDGRLSDLAKAYEKQDASLLPDDANIDAEVSARDENEADEFEVLDHHPERHDPARPLVVIVHPGDMIEYDDGDEDDFESIRRQSLENQNGFADEVREWRRKQDADIVILHRASCAQIGEVSSSRCTDGFTAEIIAARQHGSVLFGDDLDIAGNWIIKNMDVKDRPHVFLAGAYGDEDSGCLTHIGKMIEKIIPGRVSVSYYVPSRGEPWRPSKA